jgi:hypothetical protein
MTRIILILAAILAFGANARAADRIVVPAERRYSAYSGVLPPCEDGGVLGKISSRFNQKEAEYWNSALVIDHYDRVRELSLRGNGLDYIPRRYCIARAYLNDNREHTVIYQIQESLGMIGWGYGVEWCVIGLDRNFAYAPACRVLRPFAERSLGERALVERY